MALGFKIGNQDNIESSDDSLDNIRFDPQHKINSSSMDPSQYSSSINHHHQQTNSSHVRPGSHRVGQISKQHLQSNKNALTER